MPRVREVSCTRMHKRCSAAKGFRGRRKTYPLATSSHAAGSRLRDRRNTKVIPCVGDHAHQCRGARAMAELTACS